MPVNIADMPGMEKVVMQSRDRWPMPRDLDLQRYPTNVIWGWSQLSPDDPARMRDLARGWYDHEGRNAIVLRRIWALPTEGDQLAQFKQLLQDFPEKGLRMMFEAATNGKLQIVKFLFSEGVKATANTAGGDDKELVPLHAAAYRGHLDVVKYVSVPQNLYPFEQRLVSGCLEQHPMWFK